MDRIELRPGSRKPRRDRLTQADLGHVAQHIEDRSMPIPACGCIIWMGRLSPSGYGRLRIDGKDRFAHQVSCELAGKTIPKGKQPDHLCRIRCCISVDHIEIVTRKVNILRGVGITARNARKTHCDHGHEFTPSNTRWFGPKRQWRECRNCRARIDGAKAERRRSHG